MTATVLPPPERCRSCDAPIVWCVTENAKSIPVDVEPAPGGNLALSERGPHLPPLARVQPPHLAFGRTNLHTSHFVTCPQAGSWRRRRLPRRDGVGGD